MTPTWRVEFDERARKELRKLDKQSQRDILKYLRDKVATSEDPRRFGKPLGKEKWGLWRYRVYDYRIVCQTQDDRLIVLVVRVGHRKDVYDD